MAENMQIIDALEDFPSLEKAIVSSGTFDGLHLGHQKIVQQLCQTAQKEGGQSVLITFWPHPRLVLSKEKDLKLLSTLEEKATILETLGLDYLLVLPFTQDFAQLNPEAFINKVYVKALHTHQLIIGYDHHFGKNRAGNFEYLQKHIDKYSFSVKEIPRQDIEDVGISSTKIRKALQEGQVQIANRYLGRPYALSGEVVKGNQLGRTIGFPTANLQIKEGYKLVPAEGIYAVQAKLEGQNYQAMLYIGKRPTLEAPEELRIEVNIFDFEQDIYGETLEIQFIQRIRADHKFDSLEAMQARLMQDKQATLAIFRKLS